jgi:predicted dehydrogenase
MKALRLGLAGCGRLAESGYLPALRSLDELRLVAVADPDRERRERLGALAASHAGGAIARHAGVEAMLEGGIDVLVLATPAQHHLADARLAAGANVATLVEKPPAPDGDRAAELAGLDGIWIGFNRRFALAPELPERLRAASELELELELRYRRASWRAHVVRDEVLVDLAPHLVDLAAWLSGRRAAVVRAARAGAERCELELEDARGRAIVRCASDRSHLELIRARGAGRRLVRHVQGGTARNALARLRAGEHPLVASLREQLRAFAAAAQGDDPGPLATAADGEHVMRVIDAARESVRGGGAGVAVVRAGSAAGAAA